MPNHRSFVCVTIAIMTLTGLPFTAHATNKGDHSLGTFSTTSTTSGVVLDHSNASFLSGGDLNFMNIDFGAALNAGSGQFSTFFDVFALIGVDGAGLTAKLEIESFSESDFDDKFSLLNFIPNELITAGGSKLLQIAFDTTVAGEFNAAYTIFSSDENLPGDQPGENLVIFVHATVAPEPSSMGLAGVAGLAMIRRRRHH
jgi:MYXO-CTERM domain-containing protein